MTESGELAYYLAAERRVYRHNAARSAAISFIFSFSRFDSMPYAERLAWMKEEVREGMPEVFISTLLYSVLYRFFLFAINTLPSTTTPHQYDTSHLYSFIHQLYDALKFAIQQGARSFAYTTPLIIQKIYFVQFAGGRLLVRFLSDLLRMIYVTIPYYFSYFSSFVVARWLFPLIITDIIADAMTEDLF